MGIIDHVEGLEHLGPIMYRDTESVPKWPKVIFELVNQKTGIYLIKSAFGM